MSIHILLHLFRLSLFSENQNIANAAIVPLSILPLHLYLLRGNPFPETGVIKLVYILFFLWVNFLNVLYYIYTQLFFHLQGFVFETYPC